MAQLLLRDGYRFSEDPSRANVLIVNTCGFIGPARQESLDVLRDLAQSKRAGQVLIAAGCLTQRYGADVAQQVPGIDGILGTRRWMDIVQVVRELRKTAHPTPLYHLPSEAATVATLLFFNGGQVRAKQIGAASKKALLAKLDELTAVA